MALKNQENSSQLSNVLSPSMEAKKYAELRKNSLTLQWLENLGQSKCSPIDSTASQFSKSQPIVMEAP